MHNLNYTFIDTCNPTTNDQFSNLLTSFPARVIHPFFHKIAKYFLLNLISRPARSSPDKIATFSHITANKTL